MARVTLIDRTDTAQCDRRRPDCLQCGKFRRTCEGYRDPTDLQFRDQTAKVSAQASSQRQSHPRERSQTACLPATSNDGINGAAWPSCVPMMQESLRLNKHQGLIDFFTNNFAADNTWIKTNAFWLPPNFDDLLSTNKCVQSSVHCNAMMALARLRRCRRYAVDAHEKYSVALMRLAELSRRASDIDRTTFCLAALLLSAFEMQIEFDACRSRAGRVHLGAIHNLYRDFEDGCLRTTFDARMYRQTRERIVAYALHTKTSVPRELATSLPGDERLIPSQYQPCEDIDALLIRLADLQAHYYNSGPSQALLLDLSALNSDCCKWVDTLPPSWSYVERPCSSQSCWWWDAREDLYADRGMAYIWSKMRAARIIAYDLIMASIEALAPLSSSAATLLQQQTTHELSKESSLGLATDICATVPMCFRPSVQDTKLGTKPDLPHLGTAFCFIPTLEIVGSMKEAPAELTRWIIECLEAIHELTGFVWTLSGAQRLRSTLQDKTLLKYEN